MHATLYTRRDAACLCNVDACDAGGVLICTPVDWRINIMPGVGGHCSHA